MATQVKYHQDSPTKCSGDNVKKLLLGVIAENNPALFGRRIKANRTKMIVEKISDNIYRVFQFEMVKNSFEPYERQTEYIFEVITK